MHGLYARPHTVNTRGPRGALRSVYVMEAPRKIAPNLLPTYNGGHMTYEVGGWLSGTRIVSLQVQ